MPKLSDLLWDYVPDKQAFQGMGNDLLAAANRGGVAAVLGAPVDITNQLANLGRALYGYVGNKAGLLSADQMPQLDERPIGGSEWIGQKMQDAGFINGNRNHLAELLTGMVMPWAMLRGGVKANQALDAAIANAQRPGTLNTPGYKGQRGATVWHGSPHDIQPKPGGKYPEFDMSKIGTGEGAQAYGHGIYTAEVPDVAKTYANTLGEEVLVKGKPVYKAHNNTIAGDAPIGNAARNALQGSNWDLAKAKSTMQDAYKTSGDGYFKRAFDELSALSESDITRKTGAMYKVDIPDEAIPRMLDWDKPLSQQAPEVQKALEQWGALQNGRWNFKGYAGSADSLTGRQAWESMFGALGPKASEILKKQNIQGIRYLDGGSRGAGQGTSNYVLFDDKLPRILEKNGVPTGQTPWTPEEWAAYLSGGGR